LIYFFFPFRLTLKNSVYIPGTLVVVSGKHSVTHYHGRSEDTIVNPDIALPLTHSADAEVVNKRLAEESLPIYPLTEVSTLICEIVTVSIICKSDYRVIANQINHHRLLLSLIEYPVLQGISNRKLIGVIDEAFKAIIKSSGVETNLIQSEWMDIESARRLNFPPPLTAFQLAHRPRSMSDTDAKLNPALRRLAFEELVTRRIAELEREAVIQLETHGSQESKGKYVINGEGRLAFLLRSAVGFTLTPCQVMG
jgi:RecG-like helicase